VLGGALSSTPTVDPVLTELSHTSVDIQLTADMLSQCRLCSASVSTLLPTSLCHHYDTLPLALVTCRTFCCPQFVMLKQWLHRVRSSRLELPPVSITSV